MSKVKFLTFWIPNVGDIDIENPNKYEIKHYKISEDGDEKNALHLDLELDENLNLKIFNSKNKILLGELVLEYFYRDCNILIYRIKNLQPPLKIETLVKGIYHGFKEFWHQHQFHKRDEDTKLKAFATSHKPTRFEICKYFLGYFSKKYEAFYKDAMEVFNKLEDYRFFGKQYIFFERRAIPLIKKIMEIQGETIYFNFLQKCCNLYIFDSKISTLIQILNYKAETAKIEIEKLRNHLSINLALLSGLISILSFDFIKKLIISAILGFYPKLLLISFFWASILFASLKKIKTKN